MRHRRSENSLRDRKRRAARRTYKARRENGVCVICGWRAARTGLAMCRECALKRSEYMRKYYLEHKKGAPEP